MLRILGVDNDHTNQGWLCDRGRYNFEYLNSEQNQKSDLGFPPVYNLYPSTPSVASGATTQITSNTSTTFTIQVNGNGDENFKFYFID